MCITALAPILAGSAGGATAAGATALANLGTAVSIGGSLVQGIAAQRAGRAQARILERQADDEARLASIEDQRLRERMRGELARQRAELARRGISLDSPTAVLLGEEAAREMSFASQSRRSEGGARVTELSAAARTAEARGRLGLLRGGLSAVGTLIDEAPDLWPGLYGEGVA